MKLLTWQHEFVKMSVQKRAAKVTEENVESVSYERMSVSTPPPGAWGSGD